MDSAAEQGSSGSGPGQWIAIAHILRPQGRKGEVLAHLLTDQLGEFRAGRLLQLSKDGKPLPGNAAATLENHWMPMGKNAGRVVLKLQGCDSISEAELLAAVDVEIPAAELPELEADTFYVKDLIGCSVFNGSHDVGSVADVQFATSSDGRVRLEDAAPLLCVLPEGAVEDTEPLLVPLVRAYLVSVDTAAKQIVMNLPAGLLDMEAD